MKTTERRTPQLPQRQQQINQELRYKTTKFLSKVHDRMFADYGKADNQSKR